MLAALVADYIRDRIDLSPDYCRLLVATVERFSRFLGRRAMVSDLTRATLQGFLAATHGGFSPVTVNGWRRYLLCLAGYAVEFGRLPAMPFHVKRLREQDPLPEAWPFEEVCAIVAACPDVWWRSLVLSCFWTAARVGSLMAATPADFTGDGLRLRKQKNRRPEWFPLRATCCDLIRQLPGRRTRLWYWPMHRRTFFIHFRRIVESAGVPAPLTGRQLFHRLRRSTITLCDALDPALAQRQAGHASYATTKRFYVDRQLSRPVYAVNVLADPIETRPSLRLFVG